MKLREGVSLVLIWAFLLAVAIGEGSKAPEIEEAKVQIEKVKS